MLNEEALKREIDILYSMNNCYNLVKLIENFEDNNYEILILELCNGQLEDLIKQNNGIDEYKIYEILIQLNNAFIMIYKKDIILRDIKPKNIIAK